MTSLNWLLTVQSADLKKDEQTNKWKKTLEAIFEKHLQMVKNQYKGKEFQSNIKLLMGVREMIVADILLTAGNFLKYYLTPITDM